MIGQMPIYPERLQLLTYSSDRQNTCLPNAYQSLRTFGAESRYIGKADKPQKEGLHAQKTHSDPIYTAPRADDLYPPEPHHRPRRRGNPFRRTHQFSDPRPQCRWQRLGLGESGQ